MNPHCPMVCPEGASAYVLSENATSASKLRGMWATYAVPLSKLDPTPEEPKL